MQNVAFRFHRPSGSERQQPSQAMTEALHRLGRSDEMQSLVVQASKNGQMVTIEVYENRSGEPILIHIKKEAADEPRASSIGRTMEALDDPTAEDFYAAAATQGNADALYQLGTFCVRQGRTEEALHLLTAFLKQHNGAEDEFTEWARIAIQKLSTGRLRSLRR